MGTEPRLAIVGAGRHGSGYVAALLRSHGWNVGHEQWWTPGERQPGLDGDSSWLASVLLGSFAGPVFHQVRHPLRYLESLAKAPEWGEYRGLKLAAVGELIDDRTTRGLAEWVMLNRLAETRADTRWSIAQAERIAPCMVRHAIGEPEGPPGEPPDDRYNWHGDPVVSIDWADVPRSRWADEARGMTERYGL